jgi:hypothetical protein
LPNLRKKGGLGHAFPYYYRDKEWEVEDLDDIYLEKDGSIQCLVKWKPTVVKSTALVGEAV